MNLQMITAATTMNQLQKKMDTISNNMANISTVGYKRREATFQNILTETVKNQPYAQKEMGRSTPYGLRIGFGSRVSQTAMRQDQGSVQVTDRPLDLMIEGESVWFRTLRSWTDDAGNAKEEYLYTRSGAFQLQPSPDSPGEMRLVTSQGLPVLADDGFEITLPENVGEIKVDGQGRMQAYDPDFPDQPLEFQLDLVQVNRPQLLEAMGENQFRINGNLDGMLETANPEELQENGIIRLVSELEPGERSVKVRQGALEMSNVDLGNEMTELMLTQRMMQFQGKSIQMADQMMGIANTIRG